MVSISTNENNYNANCARELAPSQGKNLTLGEGGAKGRKEEKQTSVQSSLPREGGCQRKNGAVAGFSSGQTAGTARAGRCW